MTLDEMNVMLEAYQKRKEIESIERYQLANMIASFVGCCLGGSEIPSYEDVYPGYVEVDEEEEQKQLQMYREQFIDFAREHNARRITPA